MSRPDLTGPESYAAGPREKETPRGGTRRALRTFSTDRSQQPQVTAMASALQEAIVEANWHARKAERLQAGVGGADGQ